MTFGHLQSVKNLVDLSLLYGIKNVVISPGSRSAPIAILFSRSGVDIDVVVDERSAAYFAMGIALKTAQPVVLVCTSGTAAFNYAPAIAEAFYQGIPLLILTADRPLHWLNHSEGQQIDQTQLYGKHVTQFLSYDTEKLSNNFPAQHECIHSAFDTFERMPGPIHINVPIPEPLYELDNLHSYKWDKMKPTTTPLFLDSDDDNPFIEKLTAASRILIVIGQIHDSSRLNKALKTFNSLDQVVIVSDLLSNTNGVIHISNIDNILFSIKEEHLTQLSPDILITIGTNLVSKRLKEVLRSMPDSEHWHIDKHGIFPDTFKRLNKKKYADPATQLTSWFSQVTSNQVSNYKQVWKEKLDLAQLKTNRILAQQTHGELKIAHQISTHLPANSVVHLGNSLSVRYFEYLPSRPDVHYLSNRGTSGIDGCTSTAVGFAMKSHKTNTLVLGDTSFMYDINALWKESLPDNLKIIIFNNGGGGIFKFIKGPSNLPEADRLFAANHNFSMQHLAKHFSISYASHHEGELIDKALQNLYKNQNIAILEIFTDKDKNAADLKDFFTNLKQ